MKFISFLFLFALVSSEVAAQNFASTDPAYKKNVELGEQALNAEKFDSCILYYEKAFEIRQTSYLSTLRAAACGFSQGNQTYFEEQLVKAIALDWQGTMQIFENYEEFAYLQETSFAQKLSELHSAAAEASGLDLTLIEEFDQIRLEDQRYRSQMRATQDQYGWQSPQMDSLWALQSHADSVNTKSIVKIFETSGYPGRTVVGDGHASTAFLVVQHADSSVQRKYLPLIKMAAEAGEVAWSAVALLVDRVNMGLGKPQIYGSQIHLDTNEVHFFAEIENPWQIDSIRATVGLGPIQDYADHWDIKWDPVKHIERFAGMKGK